MRTSALTKQVTDMGHATVRYPHDAATGAPACLDAPTIWAVATAMRRALFGDLAVHAVPATTLAATATRLVVNDREVHLTWDVEHEVHDDDGVPVMGVCESDADCPGQAFVSINARLLGATEDLAASTAAHELGHAVFDIPSTLKTDGPCRAYRHAVRGADQLEAARPHGTVCWSEYRANEFMGAFLTPPALLHQRLLRLATQEGLRRGHRPNRGRRGLPVVLAPPYCDAVSGVVAALAGDFGVSERFIRVRLDRYQLLADAARGDVS